MSASTSELAPTVAPPALRSLDGCPALALLPVPVSQPPYDDEPAGGQPRRPVLVAAPPAPVGPLRDLAPLRLVPPLAEPSTAARAVRTPPARPVAHALVQGLLEVLAGVRPVTQLKRRTSPELYEKLEALVHALPRTTGARPGIGAVQSLHVQMATPGVAEVCATVRRGPRAAAIALRLELRDGQWCGTSVAGLPGGVPRGS